MSVKKIFLAGVLLMLTACSTTHVSDYTDEKPVLDLTKYFNGDIEAWGMFQDRSGKVTKRFHVLMHAEWSHDVGILTEHFTWSDHTQSQRIWRLVKVDAHHYQGTAADVVGVAEGNSDGNALHWRYKLQLPVNGKTYIVNMDDWMYQLDDGTMFNKTKMSKFGFHLGDITLFFHKESPQHGVTQP